MLSAGSGDALDGSPRHLDQAIESLPPSLRVVFLLREIEGLSTLETSEVLNLSETAVKTRLSRARLRLREQLTAYYGEIVQKHQADLADQQVGEGL